MLAICNDMAVLKSSSSPNLLMLVCCVGIADAVGSLHLLPLYPSTGDRGFGPVTYEDVDPKLGVLSDQ